MLYILTDALSKFVFRKWFPSRLSRQRALCTSVRGVLTLSEITQGVGDEMFMDFGSTCPVI